MVIYILVLWTIVAAGGTSVSRTDHLHVMMFCFMVKRIVGGGVEVDFIRIVPFNALADPRYHRFLHLLLLAFDVLPGILPFAAISPFAR